MLTRNFGPGTNFYEFWPLDNFSMEFWSWNQLSMEFWFQDQFSMEFWSQGPVSVEFWFQNPFSMEFWSQGPIFHELSVQDQKSMKKLVLGTNFPLTDQPSISKRLVQCTLRYFMHSTHERYAASSPATIATSCMVHYTWWPILMLFIFLLSFNCHVIIANFHGGLHMVANCHVCLTFIKLL